MKPRLTDVCCCASCALMLTIWPRPSRLRSVRADIDQSTDRARPTDAEGQLAGGFLGHIDLDNGPVRRRVGGHIGDLRLVEEIQILDAFARTAQLGGIEGVALDQSEFAADDFVQRPHIALNVDTLDKHPRPFLHIEQNVDGVIFAMAIEHRADVDEGIALWYRRRRSAPEWCSRYRRHCSGRRFPGKRPTGCNSSAFKSLMALFTLTLPR